MLKESIWMFKMMFTQLVEVVATNAFVLVLGTET